MGHCPTKYLTGWHIQLVVRNSRWVSLRRRLVGEMANGSLQLAIAPRAFAGGELVFSACRAGACGFVMGDSGQGSGATAPGRCRRYFFQDWQPTRTGSAPALDTRSGVLLLDRR